MIYYELTLYLKSRRKALCKAIFENKTSLDNFILSLSSESEFIRLGNVVFCKNELLYAEINEKEIKK